MISKNKFIHFASQKLTAILVVYGIVLMMNTEVLFAEEIKYKGQPTISLNFENFPLNAIVHMVADFTPQDEEMMHLELLDGILVSVVVQNAPAYDFLDDLLEKYGLKVKRTADIWAYSKIL